jgi:hypothetical protein
MSLTPSDLHEAAGVARELVGAAAELLEQLDTLDRQPPAGFRELLERLDKALKDYQDLPLTRLLQLLTPLSGPAIGRMVAKTALVKAGEFADGLLYQSRCCEADLEGIWYGLGASTKCAEFETEVYLRLWAVIRRDRGWWPIRDEIDSLRAAIDQEFAEAVKLLTTPPTTAKPPAARPKRTYARVTAAILAALGDREMDGAMIALRAKLSYDYVRHALPIIVRRRQLEKTQGGYRAITT